MYFACFSEQVPFTVHKNGDPLAKVAQIDGGAAGTFIWLLASLGAGLLHLGLGATLVMFSITADISSWQKFVLAKLNTVIVQEVDIEVDKPLPPPEASQPETELAAPKPKITEEKPVEQKQESTPSKEAPAAAAAQAGQILTRAPTPDEPLDFTGNTFVTGSSSNYAGGTTLSTGTSKEAVRQIQVSPRGVVGGTGTADVASDFSKPPRLKNSSWDDCGFPREADVEQIDEASVMIEVSVDATGSVIGVTVLRDPGYGFGRLARSCAIKKVWTPALNREGKPMAGKGRVNVTFSR